MATTMSTLSPAELRESLTELLGLVRQSAELEARIADRALELRNSDWEFHDERPSRFVNGLAGQIRGALDDARKEGGIEWDADDVAGQIEGAIQLLDFAIERSGDA